MQSLSPLELEELRAAHVVASEELAELRRWHDLPLENVRPQDLRTALAARARWETDGPALRRVLKSITRRLESAEHDAAQQAANAKKAAWALAAKEHKQELLDALDDAVRLIDAMIGGERLNTGSHFFLGQLLGRRKDLVAFRQELIKAL